jgi:hypothetical protein
MPRKGSGPAALATPGTRKRDLLAGEIASEYAAPHDHPQGQRVALALTDRGRLIALAFFAPAAEARRHLLAGGAA